MLQNLRAKVGARLNGDKEAGFTLIELLVVMLILGILAAIAIPAFFNQKNKANDAQSKAYAKTAQTAMETFATDHNGSYNTADADDLKAIEATLDGALLTATGTGSGYTVTVQTPDTERTFSIVRNASTTTFPCTIGEEEDRGGCPDDTTAGGPGVWSE
ncbi:MAG TPA: type II secretion system protein [Solirubrobacterales bacterium]|nr:type II secretion system protein [Solirubrobacterales bacterium]